MINLMELMKKVAAQMGEGRGEKDLMGVGKREKKGHIMEVGGADGSRIGRL